MNDCVNTFFGSHFNVSKITHGMSSQYGSQRQSSSRFTSEQGSKSTLFGLKDGSIGEGGLSIKNYIDSSRDLTMVNAGHATALAAHLRQDGHGSSIGSSAVGSKTFQSGLSIGQTKMVKDSSITGGAQAARVSKKKKEFEIAKDKMLAHLDLTQGLTGASVGKLFKNLESSRQARDRLGGTMIKKALKKPGG